MTQIMDFLYSFTSESIRQEETERKFEKHLYAKQEGISRLGTQTSICLEKKREKSSNETFKKCIPFQHERFWDYKILLVIERGSLMTYCQVKIIRPSGEVLKVISQYHRTLLFSRFLASNVSSNQTKLVGRICPYMGQLSLCISFAHCSKNLIDEEEISRNLELTVFEEAYLIADIISLIDFQEEAVSHQNYKGIHGENHLTGFVKLCSKKSQAEPKIYSPHQKQNWRSYQTQFEGRKEQKSKTYGGDVPESQYNPQNHRQKVGPFKELLAQPLETIDEICENEGTLRYFREEVRSVLGNVENSLVRKDHRKKLKNYERLKLSDENFGEIVSCINKMKVQKDKRIVSKVERSGVGKISVHIKIERPSKVQRTYKLLKQLPENIEFTFVNNYFSCNSLKFPDTGSEVIIQLAIRRQELINYLQKNSRCISFSSKLRILSQIISATHFLETKCNVIMSQMGVADFSLAKNMMLKLNQVDGLSKFSEEEKITFEQQFRVGLIEGQVNISRIYSKLFYHSDLIRVKPSKQLSRFRLSQVYKNNRFEEKEIIIDKIYEECGLYGPKNIMALLTSVFVPYIPTVSFQQIKSDASCKNLKWGIASLVKILEEVD